MFTLKKRQRWNVNTNINTSIYATTEQNNQFSVSRNIDENQIITYLGHRWWLRYKVRSVCWHKWHWWYDNLCWILSCFRVIFPFDFDYQSRRQDNQDQRKSCDHHSVISIFTFNIWQTWYHEAGESPAIDSARNSLSVFIIILPICNIQKQLSSQWPEYNS